MKVLDEHACTERTEHMAEIVELEDNFHELKGMLRILDRCSNFAGCQSFFFS